MLLLAAALGMLISMTLFAFSRGGNKVNRYLAIYFFIVSLYVLVHYTVVFSGSVFWIAIAFINPSFLFLLPGPILYFYVRGTLTGKTKLDKKDLLHFIPAVIHFLMITPWLVTDFDTKLALARSIVEVPDSIFQTDYFHSIISFYSSFLLRSFMGIGYAVYCMILIYKHHQHKLSIANRHQHYAVIWLNLFVFTQMILFIVYMASVIISYNDTTESQLIGHGSLFHISQGMVFVMLQIILLIFPWALYGIPRRLTSAVATA